MAEETGNSAPTLQQLQDKICRLTEGAKEHVGLAASLADRIVGCEPPVAGAEPKGGSDAKVANGSIAALFAVLDELEGTMHEAYNQTARLQSL